MLCQTRQQDKGEKPRGLATQGDGREVAAQWKHSMQDDDGQLEQATAPPLRGASSGGPAGRLCAHRSSELSFIPLPRDPLWMSVA